MVDVSSFLEKWGLDDSARAMLEQMPEEAQQRVVNEFSPKTHTRNMNGLFMGFCRSVGGLQRQADHSGLDFESPEDQLAMREQCEAWCAEKGLDSPCVDTLLALPGSVRNSILEGFVPKADTRNPSGLFMSYVRSMSSGPKGAAKGGGKGAPNGYHSPVGAPIGAPGGSFKGCGKGKSKDSWAPAGKGMSSKGFKGAPAKGPPGLSEAEVSQFIHQWGLDDECYSLFLGAAPGVQREMMTSFLPKADTRNVKNLFCSFLNSISRSHGASGGHSASQQPSWGGPKSYQQELFEFGQAWGLDEECGAVLARQSPDVQRALLDRFQPKGGTRDIKGLFMSFVRSLSGSQPETKGSGYGAKGGKAVKGGKDGKGYGGPVPSSFAPPRPVKRSAADFQGSGVADYEIDQFVQAWGLDESCAMSIREQPPDVQRHVIERFQPKSETNNISNLFHGFLKSFVFGPGHGKRARGM
jgi:hypothetical protein